MYSIKNKCSICNSNHLDDLFIIKKSPVFMGVNKGYNEIFCDMTFTECGKCNTVQIKELINPELVYIDNHNISIVGDLWKNHYVEFIEFLKPKIKSLIDVFLVVVLKLKV